MLPENSTACAASWSAYPAESDLMRMSDRMRPGGPALALAPCLFSLALLIGSPLARADEPKDDAVETARFEFVEGTSHFQARRWQEALRAFEHSYSLV